VAPPFFYLEARMSFSLDINTDIGKIRFLIGDTVQASANFQDETLTGFLSLTSSSIYLTCALALDALANAAATNLNDIVLGSLRINETSKVERLRAQAQAFRDLEYNTPAFDVAEENLSGFNELEIIRNNILRTQG
jgi:hypothetical protein